MKILHYLGDITMGGVASVVENLVFYSIKNGHKVDIVSLYNDDSCFVNEDRYTREGINVFRSHSSFRYSFKHILYLKDLMQNYDVVHVHIFPEQLHAAIAARLIPQKKRPALITTEHSTWNNRRKYPLLREIDKWMYRIYDRIVCISPSTKTAFINWINDKKILKHTLTIMNGINVGYFKNSPNLLPKRLNNYNAGTLYIAMVARMTPPKDPVTLVRALQYSNRNVEAIFVGDGILVEDIRKEADNLGLGNRVHIMGNQSDVASILKGCHVAVLSTNWDGFGLVAAEAMATGIPIIGSNVEGLKDVIDDEELCFPPGDYKKLSNIINGLIKNEILYKRKISEGLARVDMYSSIRMAREYLELYESIITNPTNAK